MFKKQIPYSEPLSFLAKCHGQESFAFLYSAFENNYSGKYSVLALFPLETIQTNSFQEFSANIQLNGSSTSTEYFSDGYFGYISYEAKHEFELLPNEHENFQKYPKFNFKRFGLNAVFHSKEKKLFLYYADRKYLDQFDALDDNLESSVKIEVQNFKSNFTKESYIDAVKKAQNYILDGDIFEVNISQKFTGEFKSTPDSIKLFQSLMTHSPSHYAAFLKFPECTILSSSPERFLKMKDSIINSKPIKGTRPRGSDENSDSYLKMELESSEKDRAENAMIVDLARNDLGKVAKISSVKTTKLFEVESYQTVHQMVSTVQAELGKNFTIFDLLAATFPPASMTGAPKIRAIEIASELENMERGIYSGALGYIGTDKYIDLSVIIRSLIISANKFEFQVGGAITTDSDPEAEYQESLDKAQALFKFLNINLDLYR